MAIKYDSFRTLISGMGKEGVIQAISMATGDDVAVVSKVFGILIGMVFNTPKGIPEKGYILSGKPNSCRCNINDVFILDFYSGEITTPSSVTFAQAVNLSTDADWILKRGINPAIADIFLWLSVVKHFFIGEDEEARRKRLKSNKEHSFHYLQDMPHALSSTIIYGEDN